MIADHLDRYYETHGTDPSYEVVRSIVIDGHEVAWVRYEGTVKVDLTGRGREGAPYTGYMMKCECDFIEGVGWRTDEKHGVVGLMNNNKPCLYRATAQHLRHLELREEYTQRFDARGRSLHGHAKDIILDLIEKVKAEEFIGEDGGGASFYGGYFYLQTVAAITDLFVGHLWDDVYALMADEKVGLDGAVIQPYREPPPPKWVEHFRAEEDGWVATASLPGHRDMARAWKFEILRPDGEPAYSFIPGLDLMHDPVFGPDVEDVARAEEKLGELLDAAKANADG